MNFIQLYNAEDAKGKLVDKIVLNPQGAAIHFDDGHVLVITLESAESADEDDQFVVETDALDIFDQLHFELITYEDFQAAQSLYEQNEAINKEQAEREMLAELTEKYRLKDLNDRVLGKKP